MLQRLREVQLQGKDAYSRQQQHAGATAIGEVQLISSLTAQQQLQPNLLGLNNCQHLCCRRHITPSFIATSASPW
jgi:hypothetical protein